MKQISFVLILLTTQLFGQQIILKGKVNDKLTQQGLAFANIRIAGTQSGTSATYDGLFELRLPKGTHKLIVSNIGYISDTVSVELSKNQAIEVNLSPVPVNLPEVTVLPGENPALEILRRTIEAKQERDAKINSYIYRAYTKGIVKTTRDFTSKDRSATVTVGTDKDSTKLKISGIIENESKGYFKKPNEFKDEIIARKQTANTPSGINVLTGGRLLQNFYTNDIKFFNRALISPIANEAIEFYDYLIEDTLAMDSKTVFKIYFEPLRKIDAGFFGTLYITDKTFRLIKLDVSMNAPANPGLLFDNISIIQQFSEFDNEIMMPIDYRVSVDGNPMGLFKFGFELNTIFYDYQINSKIDDSFFDMTLVKVNSDADNKDSLYWKSTQTIPNTEEELKAYARIDSVESVPKDFWDNFSFYSPMIDFGKHFSITGIPSLYSFNRVEGHTLNFGAVASNLFDKRSNSRLDLSYGFSDKKFKTEFSGNYLLGELRTTNFSFRAFNTLRDLFSESIRYNRLTSSMLSIFSKYDFRDYYYSKGFTFDIWSQAFPVLALGVGFLNRTDNNAIVNSNYSLFYKDRVYSPVQPINETKINAVTANFRLDFRKYLEDGYFKRRINFGTAYATLSGNFMFSNLSFLNSKANFQKHTLSLFAYLPTYGSSVTFLNLTAIYSSGSVPLQMMYALPGNINIASQSNSFRTLRTNEVFGDRGLVLSINTDLNDEVYRFLHLGFLVDWQVTMSAHFNAAMLEISPKSKSILPAVLKYGIGSNLVEYKKPFAEAGFSIGQAMFPFKVEFTWKLNYLGYNNFVVGLNVPLL